MRLVRDSLPKARQGRASNVSVSVSLLKVSTLADALSLAAASKVEVQSIAWGFVVPEKYNSGEINAVRKDGSRRSTEEISADYQSFMDIRLNLLSTRPPDASPFGLDEITAVRAARERVPVIGFSGRGRVDSVQEIANKRPEILFAVNDSSCGSPLLILPEESLRVAPDRSFDSSELPAPKPN